MTDVLESTGGSTAGGPGDRSRARVGIPLDRGHPEVEAARAAERRAFDRYGLEVTEHFIQVPGLDRQIRVLEVGTGSPLVMIPGGVGYSTILLPLVPELSEHRVLLVDRPGAGLSDGIDHRDWPLAELAATSIAAVFDHFELDAAPIVANSMGGLFAFRFALAHPERVTAIAQLGCPALYPKTSAPFPMRLMSIRGLGGIIYDRGMFPDEVEDVGTTLEFMGHPPGTADKHPPELLEAIYHMERLPTVRRSWLSLLQSVARVRGARPTAAITDDDLEALEQPVLLLWGSDDPFGSIETGRRGLQYFKDAEFHEVGVGHLPWADDLETCGELIRAFLSENAKGSESDPNEQIDRFDESTATPDVATSVPSYAWKSAYGVLSAMVLTIPLGIGFFVYGGIFGPLSDAGGLLVGLLLAPLIWTIYQLYEEVEYNRAVFSLGLVAVVGISLGSLGLVVMNLLSMAAETYGPLFLGVQFLGWILLGGWLLGGGLLGRRTEAVSERTAWTAIVAGIGAAGGMMTLIYSYTVGSFTLLFPVFMLVFTVGFLLWAFLLGGDLRTLARSAAQTER